MASKVSITVTHTLPHFHLLDISHSWIFCWAAISFGCHGFFFSFLKSKTTLLGSCAHPPLNQILHRMSHVLDLCFFRFFPMETCAGC